MAERDESTITNRATQPDFDETASATSGAPSGLTASILRRWSQPMSAWTRLWTERTSRVERFADTIVSRHPPTVTINSRFDVEPPPPTLPAELRAPVSETNPSRVVPPWTEPTLSETPRELSAPDAEMYDTLDQTDLPSDASETTGREVDFNAALRAQLQRMAALRAAVQAPQAPPEPTRAAVPRPAVPPPPAPRPLVDTDSFRPAAATVPHLPPVLGQPPSTPAAPASASTPESRWSETQSKVALIEERIRQALERQAQERAAAKTKPEEAPAPAVEAPEGLTPEQAAEAARREALWRRARAFSRVEIVNKPGGEPAASHGAALPGTSAASQPPATPAPGQTGARPEARETTDVDALRRPNERHGSGRRG